jgi:2',3'-cyclic-nucleotide 2'-phosphodiesterase (5'-nucleotidase family)
MIQFKKSKKNIFSLKSISKSISISIIIILLYITQIYSNSTKNLEKKIDDYFKNIENLLYNNKKIIENSEFENKNINNLRFLNLNSNSNINKEEEIINISDYPYPKLSDLANDEFLLPILGTNDIHGQAYEKDSNNTNNPYKVGGYKLLSGLISNLRKEYNNQLLWLDAGDQFTGTYESIKTTGQLMVDFYNAMKVDSVALGNHEWDNKEIQLRKWMANEKGRFSSLFKNKNLKKKENYANHKITITKKAFNFLEDNYKENNNNINIKNNLNLKDIEPEKQNLYLISNLKLKISNTTQDDLPNKMPYQIFKFFDGKIKLGVIGLMTLETSETTSGFPNNKFLITDYAEEIKKQVTVLREKGANAIIALTHVGLTCKDPKWDQTLIDEYYKIGLRKKTTKQEMNCNGELFNLLNNLPKGFLDGVISGHTHESIHHFINDVPVIQNPMGNIFSNILYLKFKKNKFGDFILLKENTLIEGPIPICSKIYNNNKRCNLYQDLTSNIKILDFLFHNNSFKADEKVLKVFESYSSLEEEIKKLKSNIIFMTDVKLERNKFQENLLGNFVSDIYKNLTNSDVGFLSAGNVRYIWEKGQVSEYEFRNMFPFGGNFSRYNVTGKNLKNIVQTLQEGDNKFYSFSGLRMNITAYNSSYAIVDMDNLCFENGEKIIEDNLYSISSNDFMLLGGDDMSKFKVNGIMTINSTSIENSLDIIENFENYLKKFERLTELKAKEYLGKIKIEYK